MQLTVRSVKFGKYKEIQLSPKIDPHDFGIKLRQAIEFLSQGTTVKVTLRFRNREVAHKEVGFQQVKKFVEALAQYARPVVPATLTGNRILVLLAPFSRGK